MMHALNHFDHHSLSPEFQHHDCNKGSHWVKLTLKTTPTMIEKAIALCAIPLLISFGLHYSTAPLAMLIGGLLLFGAIFAVNSSLHSYLIVSLAGRDGVSLDVGFYYMANAMGRLIGTLLSGWMYQAYDLEACLWGSSAFLLLTVFISCTLKDGKSA